MLASAIGLHSVSYNERELNLSFSMAELNEGSTALEVPTRYGYANAQPLPKPIGFGGPWPHIPVQPRHFPKPIGTGRPRPHIPVEPRHFPKPIGTGRPRAANTQPHPRQPSSSPPVHHKTSHAYFVANPLGGTTAHGLSMDELLEIFDPEPKFLPYLVSRRLDSDPFCPAHLLPCYDFESIPQQPAMPFVLPGVVKALAASKLQVSRTRTPEGVQDYSVADADAQSKDPEECSAEELQRQASAVKDRLLAAYAPGAYESAWTRDPWPAPVIVVPRPLSPEKTSKATVAELEKQCEGVGEEV